MVLKKFREISALSHEKQERFLKFNLKTLAGIVESLGNPGTLQKSLRESPAEFLSRYDEAINLFSSVTSEGDYPLGYSHLSHARQETSQSPTKKGKVELDDFLEAELSQEPQKGFIIGVGANEVDGVLLPIATSLTYSLSSEIWLRPTVAPGVPCESENHETDDVPPVPFPHGRPSGPGPR